MNELSWLIYAADVADGIHGVVNAAAAAGFAGTIVCAFTTLTAGGGPIIWSWEDKERKTAHHESIMTFARKWLVRFPAIAVTALLIGSVIPSQETVYAIAASEMGEEVVQSETAGKAIKALNAWLDKQIAPASE